MLPTQLPKVAHADVPFIRLLKAVGIKTPTVGNFMVWAQSPVTSQDRSGGLGAAIVREKFTGAVIAATAVYVAYANARPAKDTQIWDRNGDLRLPLITPTLDWFKDRIGQTNKQWLGADVFADFTDEEKAQRMEQLDASGFFDRYWQDQGDAYDKLRIMEATTQRALTRRHTMSRQFPEDNVFTVGQILDHAILQTTTKMPKLEVAVGDDIVKFDTPLDRHAISFASIVMQQEAKLEADKDAYAKAYGL